jgi:fumarate reductase subunit C
MLYSTITLILIIIILKLSEQLFNYVYLERLTNIIVVIFNIITEIISLIIQHLRFTLTPEVILCDDGEAKVELIKIYKSDLKYIKRIYCVDNEDEFLGYLGRAVKSERLIYGDIHFD